MTRPSFHRGYERDLRTTTSREPRYPLRACPTATSNNQYRVLRVCSYHDASRPTRGESECERLGCNGILGPTVRQTPSNLDSNFEHPSLMSVKRKTYPKVHAAHVSPTKARRTHEVEVHRRYVVQEPTVGFDGLASSDPTSFSKQKDKDAGCVERAFTSSSQV